MKPGQILILLDEEVNALMIALDLQLMTLNSLPRDHPWIVQKNKLLTKLQTQGIKTEVHE